MDDEIKLIVNELMENKNSEPMIETTNVPQSSEQHMTSTLDKTESIKACVHEYLKPSCPKLVFIYTPPKCGSTALVSSFRLFAAKKINVYHFHNESLLPKKYKEEGVTINDLIHYCAHVLNKSVYVIDVYRTPIEQKMSIFFERLAVHHFNVPTSSLTNSSLFPITKLTKRFNQLFPHLATEDYMFDMYGDKVSAAIMSRFPTFPQNTFSINHTVNLVKYIKLRLQDSAHWGSILSSIFGIHMEVIVDYAGGKGTATLEKLYAEFKKSYRIPSHYLDELKIADRGLNYYLSEKERATYFAKWTAATVASVSTDVTKPFTAAEYEFYSQISAENSYMDCVEKTSEHYFDEGCICNACMVKRERVVNYILANPNRMITSKTVGGSGEGFEKIVHTEAVKQHIVSTIHKQAVARQQQQDTSVVKMIDERGNVRHRFNPRGRRGLGETRSRSFRSKSYRIRMRMTSN